LKILLVSSAYQPFVVGGAERVAEALATSLTRAGHQVVVVTTQPSDEIRDQTIDAVSVRYVPVRNFYRPFSDHRPSLMAKALFRCVDSYNVAMLSVLSRIIAAEAPDVINTHNLMGFSVAAWSAADRLDVPIAHTMHDQYLLCHRSTMFRNGQNCSRQCRSCLAAALPRKHASARVDVAVGVSQFILDRHLRFGYFQSSESMVIYNTGLVGTSDAARSRVPGGKLRFGFLGQIIPTKGVHALIEAFLTEELQDCELWIAGREDNPYAHELRRRTQTVQNIRWLGFVEPTKLFQDIDVLVVPSIWHDAAPLVVMEAAGHGVPVLGSSRGGIPELIPPGAGWTFDPGEPGALRSALIHCKQAAAQLSQMGQVCIDHVSHLNSSDWCNQYLRAFALAIERRKARKT
jgi:glycosyltransferase involved in cell wall biosynthesis